MDNFSERQEGNATWYRHRCRVLNLDQGWPRKGNEDGVLSWFCLESDEKEARKKFVFLCPLAGQVIATVLEGIKKKKKIPSPSYPFFLSRSSFLLRCPTTPASSSLPLPAGLRITAPFPSFSAVAESKLPAKRDGKTGCGLYRSARERSHLVISLSVSLSLSRSRSQSLSLSKHTHTHTHFVCFFSFLLCLIIWIWRKFWKDAC